MNAAAAARTGCLAVDERAGADMFSPWIFGFDGGFIARARGGGQFLISYHRLKLN
jgi:hypothetical protein